MLRPNPAGRGGARGWQGFEHYRGVYFIHLALALTHPHSTFVHIAIVIDTLWNRFMVR